MRTYLAMAAIFIGGCSAHEGEANLTGQTGASDAPARESTAEGAETQTEAVVKETFDAFDQSDSDALIEEKLAALRQRDGAVEAIIAEFEANSAVESGDTLQRVVAGNQRWRAVYVLGRLGKKEAVPFLVEVALQTEPDFAAMSLDAAQTEVTIMARAIAALGELEAVDALRDLYAKGGLVARGAAVELFTLGVPPAGVYELDRGAPAEPAPLPETPERSPNIRQ